MLFKGWDFFNLVKNFVDAVIVKWLKKDNPFDDFNKMMEDVQTFTEGLAGVFYNGARPK